MKQLADISSFESLSSNNTASVNNSSRRLRVRNSIFNKGTAGDVDRALLLKRLLLLRKASADIVAQLKGYTLADLMGRSPMDATTRTPDMSRGAYGGTTSPFSAHPLGESIRKASRMPLEFIDGATDALRDSASKD